MLELSENYQLFAAEPHLSHWKWLNGAGSRRTRSHPWHRCPKSEPCQMPENRPKKPSSVCFSLFRPALRADVKCGDVTALSRFKIEPSVLPLAWAFCRHLMGQNRAWLGNRKRVRILGPTQFSGVFYCVLFSNFRGGIVLRHNCAQRPQHRVSVLRKCTDATRLVGWVHKPSQGPTRGFAVLDCGVQCRRAVIGREGFSKNLLPTFKFSEPFGCS